VADFSPYTPDPSVTNYLQGVIAPQQIATDPSGAPTSDTQLSLGANAPSASPQSFGFAPGVSGVPDAGETTDYGIPSTIASAVQSGFAPTADASQLPSVTGGALPTQSPSPPAPVVQTSPDVSLGTANLPSTPQDVAKANAAYDKKQAQQAAYAASPEGMSQQAYQQNLAAIGQEDQANKDADAAQVAQNTALQVANQAHRDRQAKQDAIDAAKNAQDQANVAKYTQLYAQQVKDAADYKVNTDRSVGVGGLIAIALSGIGDALDHRNGPNAALQIIENGIDKKIADQWAQKKALGDKAAGTKDVLSTYRGMADDDRQAQQFQKAAELQKAADDAQSIALQSANPLLKARAEATHAGLVQKAAGIVQAEAQRKVQAQNTANDLALKKEQLGVSYGELGLRRQAQADQVAQNDRDFALRVATLQQQGLSAQAAAQKAQAEQVQEHGFQVSLGTNKQGKEQFAPAVNQDGTPYVITDKDLSNKVHERDEGYVGLITAYDKMRELRQENGGSLGATVEARKMAQQLAAAQVKYMQAQGLTRVSDVTMDQAERAAAGDKDVLNSFVKSIEPNLDAAREEAQAERINMHRRTGGFTGDARQFMIPDTVNAPKSNPLLELADKLRPQSSAAPISDYVAPQTTAPSVINNFDRPVQQTVPIAATPMSPFHDYVVNKVLKKKK